MAKQHAGVIALGVLSAVAFADMYTPGWNYGRGHCGPNSGSTTAKMCRDCCNAGVALGHLAVEHRADCHEYCSVVSWQKYRDELPWYKKVLYPSPYDPENQ